MADSRQFLDAPVENADEKLHRRQLANRANASLPMNGNRTMQAPLVLASYTVAEVPAAAGWESGIIYVSNEAGGKTLAFSDGVNWRRVQDRAVIS